MYSAYELPHFNCDLLDLNGTPVNQYVQTLGQPFELYNDQQTGKYWLLHNVTSQGASTITYNDNIANTIGESESVEFRPNEKPR